MANISAVKEITEKLENGIKNLFISDEYANYLQTMTRFHMYSTRNTILIHLQMPTATRVAGYNSWKNNFGRQVKKGEHGIKIFAPMPFAIKKELAKLDPETQQPIIGEDGQPLTEEYIQIQSTQYRPVTVFDISQTEGDPLPTLVENITGNIEHYELFMDVLHAISPLPIQFEVMPDITDGICTFGKKISIRQGMSQIQTVSAAIHEITHAKLHDLQVIKDSEQSPKDLRTEEIEAESVSYAVCQYYGIETSKNSFGYIAEWSKNRELKELNSSLDVIRKTAAELIDSIDAQYRTLANERNIDLSVSMPEMMVVPESPSLNLPDYTSLQTNSYAIGSNILMPPLFHNGNYNRTGKKIRVTVEEPIGKYQLFSRAESDTKPLYLLTASGFIDRISEYFRNEWNEQTNRWENHRPTETELDAIIPLIAEQFESNLKDPTKWAKYQHSALLNRIAECDAHNIAVRHLRDEESRQQNEKDKLMQQEEKQQEQEKYDARINEIASAIQGDKTILVAYSEHDFNGKNPVLDLFKLYGITLPVRTQGWVNTGLAEISGDTYRYYKGKHKGDSTAFGGYLKKLSDAIRVNPIENLRQNKPLIADMEVKNTLEHQLYENFSAMFPEFIAGTYDVLRLEAEDAKPLVLEWIFGDTISIAHTYELNGNPAYEPRVILKINPSERTMTAASFELTEPPRLDPVYDSNGNKNSERQQNINNFMIQWLDRASKQHFIPVEAQFDVDENGNVSKSGLSTDKTIIVSFDAEGNPNHPSSDITNNAEYELFSKFSDQFPDIVNGKFRYMKLESIPFEPLSIEWISDNCIAIMHYFTQNGDLCYDPLMEFEIDITNKTLTPLMFEQSIPPEYLQADKNEISENSVHSELHHYAAKWFLNISQKGYIPTEAYLVLEDGNEITVTFDKKGNMIVPQSKDAEEPKTDISPPDISLTIAAMNNYGYKESDMYPLSLNKALELFDSGQIIYLLYTNNTETLAFDRDEIITFGSEGFFGITKADWEMSLQNSVTITSLTNSEDHSEDSLQYSDDNSFSIYQVRDDLANGRDLRFSPISELNELGLSVDRSNYNLVYTGTLAFGDPQNYLDEIYIDFQSDNPDRSKEYHGRSVSVSDVIVLNQNGNLSSYYVDSFGFVKLPDFLSLQNEKAPHQPQKNDSSTFSQIGKSSDERHTKEKPSPVPTAKTKQSLLSQLDDANQQAIKNRKQSLVSSKKERGFE